MKPFTRKKYSYAQRREHSGGYAILTSLVLVLAVSLTIIGGFTFFSLKEASVTRAYIRSIEARAAAESGIEDGVYRVITGRQLLFSETLGVGNATTTITFTPSGNERTIRADGIRNTSNQSLETHIAITTDLVNFFYGIQVSDGGLSMLNNSTVNGSVFSNGDVLGSPGASITGDVIVAGGIPPSPQDEWTTHDTNQEFATSSSSRDIGQSFTATATGILSKISVYLAKVGTPSSNITLRITTDNAGKPAASDIANTTIVPSQIGSSASWIDMGFPIPPTLTSGTKYWIVLDYGSNSTSDYWIWRKDSTDGYAGNTGSYTSNWSTPSATWIDVNGDLAFRVWIGGSTTKVEDMIVGDATTGTGRANLFENTTIRGSSCPNAYCIVENPPRQELPLSQGVIDDWKNAAAAGGTCAPPVCDSLGNFSVLGGASKSLGPIKINGNLTVNNGSTLTLTGTIWVTGTIDLSNNCIVKLNSGYATLSGIMLTNSTVSISNNCIFQGSGQPGSYVMLLSDKNDPTGVVMDIANNSLGVIYYASKGIIHFSNNAQAKEATGYGISLDNNAVISYETGLQNINFTSGPGGGYNITYWREVE